MLHGSQEKLSAVRERPRQLPEPRGSLRGQGGRGHGSSLCPFPAPTTASAADPGKASQRPGLFCVSCTDTRVGRRPAGRRWGQQAEARGPSASLRWWRAEQAPGRGPGPLLPQPPLTAKRKHGLSRKCSTVVEHPDVLPAPALSYLWGEGTLLFQRLAALRGARPGHVAFHTPRARSALAEG